MPRPGQWDSCWQHCQDYGPALPYHCMQGSSSNSWGNVFDILNYHDRIDNWITRWLTLGHFLPSGFRYQSDFPVSFCNMKEPEPSDPPCRSHVSLTRSWVVAKQLSDWLHKLKQLGRCGGRYTTDELLDVPLALDTWQKLCSIHWHCAKEIYIMKTNTDRCMSASKCYPFPNCYFKPVH